MMLELQQAIELAMITVDSSLKEQAMQYCNSIKTMPNGWKMCLDLALENSTPEIRFFCFQVIEETVRFRYSTLSDQDRLLLRKTCWGWLQSHITQKFPYFLKTKLFVLIIVMFKNEYPHTWPTFFDELFSILQPQNTRSVKSFLQLCLTIDEEVVCHYISRTEEEMSRNTIIKDTMRDHAIPRLVDTWHSIFMNYSADVSIATLCLNLFGLYVSWIDIQLVLREPFLASLFECFATPLKCAACECLSNIILKGMKPSDKLNLVQGIGVIPFLTTVVDGDPDFEEQVAKLVNTIGLELCACYDGSVTEEEKTKSISMLDSLFPLLLKYLGNAYDDTTSALFPFLSNYLLLLKRTKRANIQGIPNTNLRSLLEVLAIKMKYDQDEEYRCGEDADEDDALFLEMRKSLKTHLESISSIDETLFNSCICELVCRTFDTIQSNASSVSWPDAELAVYLLYGFGEAKVNSGIPVYVQDGSPTVLGLMLSKLMESGVSQYPHPSIPTTYFEVLIRYSKFFEQRQDFIPSALQSFVDARGLFHPIKSLRLRTNYLFLRFVKALRPFLGQYTESVLSVIQPLLVIKQRLVQKLDAPSDFDSQVYLFEAVGYLISVDTIPDVRKGELLTIVMTPSLLRIEQIMGASNSGNVDPSTVGELGDLISSIGGLSKGFPDYDCSDNTKQNTEVWSQPFVSTLKGILIVLGKFNNYPNIRESVRFALQRMAGCMGPELLEFVPSFLSSGLLSSESAKELIEFLPFINQMVYKFQHSIRSILITVWKPLREKIDFFLSQPPVGTDDVIDLLNLRKADLTLITTFFNAQLDDVLCCQENLSVLNGTLSSILESLDNQPDPVVQKLILSLFGKMIYCWGQGSLPVSTEAKGLVGAPKGSKKDVLRRSPLPGFDNFIYDRILMASLYLPMKPTFVITDGQSLLILAELANIHKTAYTILGQQYCDFLVEKYLSTLPSTVGFEFANAVVQLDKKQLKKYFKVFFLN